MMMIIRTEISEEDLSMEEIMMAVTGMLETMVTVMMETEAPCEMKTTTEEEMTVRTSVGSLINLMNKRRSLRAPFFIDLSQILLLKSELRIFTGLQAAYLF
jgi:hypothetical protein